MCGIAGIWRTTPGPSHALISQARLMASAISRRGPDDSGSWVDDRVGLAFAHQRLSIIDITQAGHQPMTSHNQRFVIVFNGEIYNHMQLRRLLVHKGDLNRPWRGQSDTETLLACIEVWGLEETVKQAVGMFAIALWDRIERTLCLARDRFGEKPLYWGWIKDGVARQFLFASDLASFRAITQNNPFTLNSTALHSFFRFGYVPAPLTIYSDIYQLLPGHLLTLPSRSNGFASVQTPVSKPWWDSYDEFVAASTASPFLSTGSLSDSAGLSLIHDVLQESVLSQAHADVPLGSFLSGGIDSSLITSILQANSIRQICTFTVSFPDSVKGQSGFNEAPFARSVADYLHTNHTEVPLTDSDALSVIPSLSSIYSEPFADPSQIPTHLVCREAKSSGISVTLTGDGGDEFFGGYNRHRLIPILFRRFGPLPSSYRFAIACILNHIYVSSRGLNRDKRRKLAASIKCSNSLSSLYRTLTYVWSDTNSLLQPDWHCAPPTLNSLIEPLGANTIPDKLMIADVISYLPGDILVKLDRAAMATSLETRAPFLDHRLATLAWQLPLKFKIRDGVGKWALRQLLYRYVPAQLVDRPKAGFALPIGVWLRGPLRSWAEQLLDPQLLTTQGYLRPDSVQRVWKSHLTGDDRTRELWTLLIWQMWLSKWFT